MTIITKKCSIENCDKFAQPGRKGWCLMHYTRWRSNGDPLISKYDRSIRNVTKMIEYKSWQSMKERCLNKSYHNYSDYGGRGIRIHESWVNSFQSFYAHIGTRPSLNYSLERIDNNGNYQPGNVRWATKQEQASNRRTSILFTIGTETKTLKQWCDFYQLKYKTVHARIQRGVPFNEALY